MGKKLAGVGKKLADWGKSCRFGHKVGRFRALNFEVGKLLKDARI